MRRSECERALRHVLGVFQDHDITDDQLRPRHAHDLVIGKVPGLDRQHDALRARNDFRVWKSRELFGCEEGLGVFA
jgi:hypothetical protein